MSQPESLIGVGHKTGRASEVLPVAFAVTVAAACSGPANRHDSPTPKSTLRAIAILTSEHPVDGQEKVLHGPLVGYSVTAVSSDGHRVTSAVDHSGIAVLSLAGGRYVITTSLNNACPPATVVLAAAETRTVDLHCVGP